MTHLLLLLKFLSIQKTIINTQKIFVMLLGASSGAAWKNCQHGRKMALKSPLDTYN
jgi:hypothetical protein